MTPEQSGPGAVRLCAVAVAVVLSGYASYYAVGVMEQVWAYRLGGMPACAECVGFVAMVEPENLGRRVWLRADGDWLGPFLVIDCAAEEDRPRMHAAGRIVEVDTWLARRWGMRGPVNVQLRFDDPYAARYRRIA